MFLIISEFDLKDAPNLSLTVLTRISLCFISVTLQNPKREVKQ